MSQKKTKSKTESLGQYMTPAWAARELYEAHFSDMDAKATGFEPTCGDGRMLQAIPANVPAFGCEIDPMMAAAAQARTGRQILIGNVLEMDLPRFSFVFGNPPFQAKFLDHLLVKIHECMDDGSRCGLVLPAYFMQSPSRVVRWNREWTLYCELLPRTLFPRSRLPLIFSLFTKDPVPVLRRGMRLFIEAESIENMQKEFRDELNSGRGLWKPIVTKALKKLGGRAHLAEIYQLVGNCRPSQNEWWKEKVRQTLQRGPYISHGAGVWEVQEEAA